MNPFGLFHTRAETVTTMTGTMGGRSSLSVCGEPSVTQSWPASDRTSAEAASSTACAESSLPAGTFTPGQFLKVSRSARDGSIRHLLEQGSHRVRLAVRGEVAQVQGEAGIAPPSAVEPLLRGVPEVP